MADDKLICVTRDGTEHELAGPPNMANGDHRASMRFALGSGTWAVTFRKFPNSERWGEIEARKHGVE
jgi:hypothetical protein